MTIAPKEMQSLLDAMPLLFVHKDRHGKIIRANGPFAARFGVRADEMAGTPMARWTDEEPSSEELEVLRSGEPKLGVVTRVAGEDGMRRWIRTDRSPQRDPEGRVVGLYVFIHETPDHPGRHTALLRSEETLRSVVAAGPDMMFVLTAAGRYEAVLCSGHEGLFAPPEELEGESIHDILPRDAANAIQKVIDRTLATQELQEYEYVLPIGSAERTFSARIVPLASDSQPAVLWSARDVTEQKQAELERRTLEDGLRHAQKLESLGVLAGGIAHDFNNLLVPVLGSVEFVLDDLPASSEHREILETARNAALKAAALCQQMLAYSGKGQFVLEPVDLGYVIRDAERLLAASVAGMAELSLEYGDALPPVEGDRTQLLQVVMNLVGNAGEAQAESAGVVRVRTGTQLCSAEYLSRSQGGAPRGPGRYVYLEVVDEGVGMADTTLDRMFDPFFTTKFTGRGLGLAAVLGIVSAHAGAIFVDSVQGRGTSVRVVFPVASTLEERAAPSDSDCPQRVVLVVDDQEAILRIASRSLQREGYSVLTATGGHDALKLLEEHGEAISIVVLDMTMPAMNGHETLTHIRRLSAGLPVLLMSGFTENHVLASANGQSVSGFLQKPFGPRALLDAINAALAPSD
ncbi:MAG: response regulator [Myxococcota bacterium]